MFARLTKATLVLFTVIGILVAVGIYHPPPAKVSVASFRTTAVQRGDLISAVGAEGTVEPEEVVDVGAQVVGRVKALGIDPNDPTKSRCVDYGSQVNDGTVLAWIDDAVYQAQLDQAEAALERAQADLVQAQALLDQADKELRRPETSAVAGHGRNRLRHGRGQPKVGVWPTWRRPRPPFRKTRPSCN